MSDALGRYLRPGSAQHRVVAKMTTGHARAKHGVELGNPAPEVYEARVREHLQVAPITVGITDGKNRERLLVADGRTNQVAWITPHHEHRSTFFQPRRGAEAYVRAQHAISGPDRWRPFDAAAARRAGRTPTAHRTASVARQAPAPELGR